MLSEIKLHLEVPLEEIEAVYQKLIPEISAKLADSLDSTQNPVGNDLDPQLLVRIERLLGENVSSAFPTWYRHLSALVSYSPAGVPLWQRISRLREVARSLDAFEEAQLRELAFWRWVAFTGYQGTDPRCFPLWQRRAMLSAWRHTGWPVDRFRHGSLVEIGCGPMGMLEFVSAAERVGFDTLNAHYDTLFSKIRANDIHYVNDLELLVDTRQGEFDLGICYNVLDHTDRPRELFSRYFGLIRPGGHFLFEVNLVDKSQPRTEEHRRMHPSPFSEETAVLWLENYSDDYETYLSEELSADNEYFFMAWGRKRDSV